MFDSLPFFTFIFIAAFTPGPNNCMALSHAAHGLRKGMAFCCGVFGGMLVVMLACGFFSNFLASRLTHAQDAMKILGAAYMAWLAWSLWKSSGISEKEAHGNSGLLFTGCVLQLINPKIVIYGLTAYSVFILPVFRDDVSLFLFATLLAFVGFVGTVAWAVCGAALEKSFRSHPKRINRVLAGLVLGCAASMVA